MKQQRFRSLVSLTALAWVAGCSAGDDDPSSVGRVSSAVTTASPIVRSYVTPNGSIAYYRESCSTPTNPGFAKCFSVVRSDAAGNAIHFNAPSGYGPPDLQSAYSLLGAAGAGDQVAIVDAFDNPNAESDLATYRSQYGLPACSSSSGCFKKVGQTGSTTSLPAGNTGWGTEIDLDIEMVSAACPNCKILLVEANSTSSGDLFSAVQTAVSLGARYISNSYGASESDGIQNQDATQFDHPDVAVFASTGDGGFGVSYPASSFYVTAVGGTSLNKASNKRGWSETAWGSSGSGCSTHIRKPAWQHDTGCAKRTVADVAAVADINTGVAVYDTYGNSGWMIVGGTSVASPLVAGIYAAGARRMGPSFSYNDPSLFTDVTSGSNGTCGNYLCQAGPGYDGPTGNGTPTGPWPLGPTNFAASQQWSGFFCQAGEVCRVADVNGDGRADVVAFNAGLGGQDGAYVGLSTGTTFQGAQEWSSFFCQKSEDCEVADVNGDGLADAVAFNHGLNGQNAVYVGLSNGSSFGSPQQWSPLFCQAGEVCKVADVNGDGKADLIAFNYGLNGHNAVYVGLSNGSGFGSPQQWSPLFCRQGEDCEVADVDGDGKADVVAYNHGLNGGTAAFVGLSNGTTSFGSPQDWSALFCVAGEVCGAADVNGDGLGDAIAFNHGNGGGTAVFTGRSTGAAFSAPHNSNPYFCVSGETCATGDVNGDGKSDIIAFTGGASPRAFVGIAGQ